MSEGKSLSDIAGAAVTYAPQYIHYLKSLYTTLTPTKTSDHQWPPSDSFTGRVFNLAMIKEEKLRSEKIDNFVRMTITGKIDDILYVKSRIELNEIFKEAKQRGKRKVILMEGAPGCGKSTLSLSISQQWGEGEQFLAEFEAVILVRLRDPAVQSARTIADLLPSLNDDSSAAAQQAFIVKMNANKFQNVLFILDGWDELPSHLRKNSIFLDLIQPDLRQNEVFQESSVIVTSRPIASGDLHSLVSLRIEILGFTPIELRKYFLDCLSGDSEAVKILIEKIEENPVIAGICRLPLNASILVHLYKEQLQSLPDSHYGIFSLLICTCVSRHLKERTEYKSVTFKSLDQILATDVTADQFKFLCELAYKGVMDDKITFSSLPDDVDTLSLLQAVESFIKHAKTSISYSFIHLSLQEVLAALYMARQLTESEQVKKFDELFHKPRFIAVFQFYAAITKLKTSGIQDIIDQIGKRCSKMNRDDQAKTLFISLLHCLNEAQDQSLCNVIIKHLQYGLNLGNKTMSPADCWSTGYFLSRVCKSSAGKFQVSLYGCSIDDQGCRYLIKGLQKCIDNPSEATTVLNLNLKMNCIGEERSDYLSRLFQTCCIGTLHLNGNSSLSDSGVKCISEQLSNDTSLKELGIYECGITANGINDVATALMTNTSLTVLNVGANAIYDHGIEKLAHALKFNISLKKLNLACCGMTNVGLRYVVELLHENTTLTDLKINNFIRQKHPNMITNKGNAIQHLFSCLKKRLTSLTLVLPKDFESSIEDIQKDIIDARTKSKMALADVKLCVDGHTLAEIGYKGEDEDGSEAAQSDTTGKDHTLEVSDIEERDGSKQTPTQAPALQQAQCMQKSASFRCAEERAEIPFLHHQVLECNYRGLEHIVTDHDITLRVPEGAVSKEEVVHFEIGVTMYGPFNFPENTRPISPIIWLCLLEEDYELQKEFEIYVPHFLMHLTEQRIQQYQVCFAKAHHNYSMEVQDNHDVSYTFRQFGSQPSFIFEDEKHYAVLTSKHCCFLCLSAPNTNELALVTEYCVVRIEPSPREVYFLATFLLETCLQSLKEQFGIDNDQIACCSSLMFKNNEEQEPYIKMVIPSEYPSGIIVAKHPTTLKIKASDIDFWSCKQKSMEFKHKMKMYPPRLKVTVDMSNSTLPKFKLPIKFEGSLNEDLDTELIFPLQSSISPLISKPDEQVQTRANAGEVCTEKGELKKKRKRSDSDEHTESCSKVARIHSLSPDEADEAGEGSEVPEMQNGSKNSHNGALHTEIIASAASSSTHSGERGNKKTNPKLAAQPTPKNLVLIEWMDKTGQKKQLRIKKSICNQWKDIGALLEIPPSSLMAWETTYIRNPLDCIEPVMSYWFENPTDDYPVSWEGLKKLLQAVELYEVAKRLEQALSNS